MKDIPSLALRLIENNIYSFTGFFMGAILILITYIPFDNFFEKILPNIYWRIELIFLTILLWSLYWIFKRNEFPQTKNKLIGLIVAIQTENDIQMLKIKNDFAQKLVKNIKENKLDQLIDVLVLNNYQSKQIKDVLNKYSKVINKDSSLDPKTRKKYINEWKTIQKRIRGHFFITGNIKVRNDNESKYFFDNLEGLVIHKEVNDQIAVIIKNEFIKSWWESINFPEKFELNGFYLTADLIYIAVKYIVGIAAFVSGDLDTAIKLHEKLSSSFAKFKTLPPNLESINNQHQILLAEEYLIKARKYYYENKNLSKIREYLDKSFNLIKKNYGGHMLDSLYYFVNNDLDKSLDSIDKAQNCSGNDGTWRYNKAFLLMRTGKIKESFKLYKDISKTTYPLEKSTLKEVFEFCENLLKIEKNNYVLNFILGFLYLKKGYNYPLSLKYFEIFIKKCKNKLEFKFLLSKAIAYKNICEKKMNLN